MRKKIIILLFIILAIFLTARLNKYLIQKRARQEAYNAALNKKAEEISLKFLEGWNNTDMAEYLEQQGVLKKDEFLKSIRDFNNLSDWAFLPKQAQGNLQGFLYPDTYRFFKNITDRSQTTAQEAGEDVIKKLLNNFKAKLPSNAEIKAKEQGLSLYQAVILASIVEKEANNFPNEKATIAGIFYNRLNIGMPLQSDATVNYATGKSEASPSLVDLEINSPYNTYKHKGLPPTPICNPSTASINAVLNPIDSEFLYYLHDQKTGEPYYAQTHEEHIQNKFKYLK